MNDLIEAIKANDYMKVKALFTEAMKEKTVDLLESRKITLAKSIMIEGEEEPKDDDEDDGKDTDDESGDDDEGDAKDDKKEED